MQKPEVILGILNKRSIYNLDIDHIYKCFYNTEWYLYALKNLTSIENDKDINNNFLSRIDNIISKMQYEQYTWSKNPKYNTSFNKLTVNNWSDRLIQEVIYLLLSTIYEPRFNIGSCGFREKMGCHTALIRIRQQSKACEWFINEDIKDIYSSIDKSLLLSIIKKTIKDGRFIELMRKMLISVDFKQVFIFNNTFSSTAYSNNKLFELLINIYLNELDSYIEENFMLKYNQETMRPRSKEYSKITQSIVRKTKILNKVYDNKIVDEIKVLRKKLRTLPTKVPIEETTYRRLSYTRYCDSFVISFTGTFNEALEIKQQIRSFLKETLKLDIVIDNAQVIKANKKPVRFLNYNIMVQQNNNVLTNGKRSLGGEIGFFIPHDIITNIKRKYTKNNKPIHLGNRLLDPIFDIITSYQYEYSNICQYYKFARNQQALNTLKWIIETSLAKTLAAKLKISVNKVFKKFKDTKMVNGYTYKVLSTKITSTNGKEYEAYFGTIPLKRQIACGNTTINDFINNNRYSDKRVPLALRLENDVCRICGATENIEIHHMRALKDIVKNKPEWIKKLSSITRKTIAVCHNCHIKIHNGKL